MFEHQNSFSSIESLSSKVCMASVMRLWFEIDDGIKLRKKFISPLSAAGNSIFGIGWSRGVPHRGLLKNSRYIASLVIQTGETQLTKLMDCSDNEG